MFRKIAILILFLVFFCIPASSFGQEASPEADKTASPSAEASGEEYDFASMTTYEMFWPLVAGKVPGDRLYSLKVWRDKLMGLLYFGRLKKSEYLKQIANKRLIESDKLVELERFSPFAKTLKESGENLARGLALLEAAPEGNSRVWLMGEYQKDLKKHLIVLQRMSAKVGESEKEVVNDSLEKLKELGKERLKLENL